MKNKKILLEMAPHYCLQYSHYGRIGHKIKATCNVDSSYLIL